MIPLLKKITDPFYKRYHFWYHKKPRKYTYKKVWTIVQSTVFSPIHTQSTKILLDYLSTLTLKNKSLLELGCGSGIIALFCAYSKAIVTATDINKTAIKSLKKTALYQNLNIKCIASDLFKNISKFNFDYIIINPPFYPKDTNNIAEKAWYCGTDFGYFKRLFKHLPNHISKNTTVLMILSKDCQLQTIFTIAYQNNLTFKELHSVKWFYGSHTIYNITLQT